MSHASVLLYAFCAGLVAALVSRVYIQRLYRQNNMTRYSKGISPRKAAEMMLHGHGDVRVVVGGISSDGAVYNGREKTLSIAGQAADRFLVTGLSATLHECGHAIQHRRHPRLARFVSFTSRLLMKMTIPALLIIIVGIAMRRELIYLIGIGVYCAMFVWNIVTIPYEGHANRLADDFLDRAKILNVHERVLYTKLSIAILFCSFANMFYSFVLLLKLVGVLLIGRGKRAATESK